MNIRAGKLTISILLCVGLLCCSFSVYAVDPSPTPTVPPVIDPPLGDRTEMDIGLASYYIWLILNSWGIDVQFGDIWEFNSNVKDWMIEIILDYCLDLGVSAAQLVAPWLFSFDTWGNLMANDRALEDINAFALWLELKFNLQDNNIVVLDPTITVNGATVFESNTYYESEDFYKNNVKYSFMSNSTNANGNGVETQKAPYWFILYNPARNEYNIIEYQPYPKQYYWAQSIYGIDDNGNYRVMWNATGGDERRKFDYVFRIFSPYPSRNPSNGNGISLPTSFTPMIYSQESWNDYYLYNWLNSLTSFEESYEGNQKIVVGIKAIPEEGVDYDEGDSLIIIGNEPSYEIIDWDGTVQVANLPAIVSTGTVENPHLEEAYRPIQGLITYAKDGIAICTSLLYELPDEMVYMWYGLLASIIVWGMIKLMREH